MTLEKKLRICINAQISPGKGIGGVVSVLTGLISTLGKLDDGNEEYIIIGPRKKNLWLKSHIGKNQRLIHAPLRENIINNLGILSTFLHGTQGLGKRLLGIKDIHTVPVSNGFYERLGCDVIHFPYQQFIVCAVPSIYNPHDLQHRYYPHFFKPKEIAEREVLYRTGCRLSTTVAVASEWVKQDLVKHYQIHPEKIQIIPWAPPTKAYPEPDQQIKKVVKEKYNFDSSFGLYTAATWQHKNHIRLLEAIALLRDRDGIQVNLVCTGFQTDFFPNIKQRLKELRLEKQVKFLGFVPSDELRAIYQNAQFSVVPTLFEATSTPVSEAWNEGTPCACSNVTSLPEQAGDAALIFDPFSVHEIADAIKRLKHDSKLRSELVKKGKKRLLTFPWERVAKAYRAVYRRTANYPLTEEDKWLLKWNWMDEY